MINMSIYSEFVSKDTPRINEQKHIGSETLKRLSSTFRQTAYLAGGMLRDHYFENPGQDFDFYIQEQEGFEYETFMVAMLEGISGLSDFKQMEPEDAMSGGYAGGAIHSVYEGTVASLSGNYSNHPMQIIVLKMDPLTYINEVFCCSLSMTWQTAEYGPVYSKPFLDSVVDKEIRFEFHPPDKFNNRYVNKIVKRFPTFEIDDKTKRVLVREVEKTSTWRTAVSQVGFG